MDTLDRSLAPVEMQQRLHRGLVLEYFSIGWMTVESAVSILAGITAGSFALVSFGGDSFIELVSAFAVAVYLKRQQSGKADARVLHRAERVTTVLLFALIPIIGVGAAFSYFSGARAESSFIGIVVAIGAVLVMPVLWLEKRKIGRETMCVPLCIDAVESATCFFMSIALLGGLLAISFFGFAWVDYLATGIILVFVAREAFHASRESTEFDSGMKAVNSGS